MTIARTIPLTQEFLKEILYYDSETGIFTWKIKKAQCAIIGERAGSVNSGGYRKIMLNNKSYPEHQLAWMLFYGEHPNGEIDHINHKKDDNRISNLRSVSHSENVRNKPKMKNNTSGYNGVTWCKQKTKWQAYIRINKILKHLGFFSNKNEAIIARKEADMKYGFHAQHGI